MKIGLFFGSFNPIHIGHMIIANIMAEHTDLDKVWFVVSPHNPLKRSQSLLHEHDRYDMVEKAIMDNPNLKVTDIEFRMPRPSYTVDTLAFLSDKYSEHTFVLIIGEDNLNNFHKWKNYEVILSEYGLYVYPRPGKSGVDYSNYEKVKMIDAPLLNISATFIRNCVRKDQSIKYLVPEAVEQFIKSKKLFL